MFPLRAQPVALIAILLIAGAQAAPPTSASSTGAPPAAQPAPAAAPHPAPPPRTAPPARVEPFSFATVQHLAQQRSQEAYRDRSSPLPTRLQKLSYDQYRDIRYKGQVALWHDQALFEVQFFHRGFTFARQVNINEVNAAGTVRPVLYSPTLFTFGHLSALTAKDLPQRIGFAGFRVHYPLHTTLYKDELAVFLGASYFKVLGRRQGYGLSARGLAVNTATVGGEEFPAFTDFWLVRPEKEQRVLTIYALLDSESVTGAYRFDIHPDSMTQVEVRRRSIRATTSRKWASPRSPPCSYLARITRGGISTTSGPRCTTATGSIGATGTGRVAVAAAVETPRNCASVA